MAVRATSSPMGQQVYEDHIASAVRRRAQPNETVAVLPLTTLRARQMSGRRYPTRLAHNANYQVARNLGRLVYRTRGLVHRFDLRLPPAAGAEIITIHDLPPLRFPDEGTIPRSAAAGARRARSIIVPSEFARREIVELLDVDDHLVHVVPYGLAPEFASPTPADEPTRRSFGLTSSRYVVHAAGATQRKNLSGLADAWRLLASDLDDVDLCLIGPPDPRRDNAFRDLPRVHCIGRQPPTIVAALMTAAAAVVVPSVYEGFGLPALEGMACGTPVIASTRGALPEVCGDAALLVEPDGPSLADALATILAPASSAASKLRIDGPVRAARFSWDAAAERHLEIYRATARTHR